MTPRLLYTLVSFGLISVTLARPAAAGPITSVTLSAFRQIVQRCVTHIPDLQRIWTWQEANPGYARVYFGGGALRGLLRNLAVQLERGVPPSRICAGSAPSVDDLLILKGADRDLYVKNGMSHDYKTYINQNFAQYGSWDVLDESFNQASMQAGGPTIEKLYVSPTGIVDPYDALASFHRGELHFENTPEYLFRQFRGNSTVLQGNSKTALALRMFRFTQDLPSAELPDDEVRMLRKIILDEYANGQIAMDNYWVKKALGKLFQATDYEVHVANRILGKDVARVLGILGYRYDKNGAQWYIGDLTELSVAEIQRLKAGGSVDWAVRSAKELLDRADTAEDFVRAFDIRGTISGSLLEEYRNLYRNYYRLYASTRPSREHSNRLASLLHTNLGANGHPSLEAARAVQAGNQITFHAGNIQVNVPAGMNIQIQVEINGCVQVLHHKGR